MSSAYDPSEWSDLFVASAGAAAALTGLVFVAVSINIEHIIKMPGLPDRALATLILLFGPVTISILALIPDAGRTTLGILLLAVGSGFAVAACVFTARSLPAERERSWTVSRLTLASAGTVPFAIAGLSLLLETGGGLAWAAAGIIAALTGGVITAWVLLVEILR
jgi:hypothetical protein